MTHKRALPVMSWVAPCAFACAALAALLVPVYTDEVGWRLQERAGLDGVDKQFSVLCGPTTLARPPFWMMPVRYYSAFFNSRFPDPLYTKLSGILYALLWAVLIALLVRRIAPDRQRMQLLAALAFGLVTIGLTPLLLAWSRPEQPILLCLTGAALLSACGWRDSHSTAAAASLRALGIVLLAAIALSYHLKSVFLAAVFAACVIHSSHGAKAWWPRLLALVSLCVLTVQGARYWVARLDCPGDRGYVQSQNLGAKLLAARNWREAGDALLGMAANVNPFPYLGRTAPRPDTMTSWLAQLQVDAGTTRLWWLAIGFAWVLAALFAAEALVSAARASRAVHRIEPRLTLSLALVLTVLAWSATQVMQNDYEVSFVVPMLMLAITLALSCENLRPELLRGVQVLALAVVIGSLVSMALVGAIYGPSLSRALGERGYIAAQPASISPFGYGAMRARILRLARECGLAPDRSRNLVVDDLTYYAFMPSPLPDHVAGLWSPGLPVVDRYAYLRGRPAGGIITACEKLPPEVRRKARSDGEICCLAPPWP